MKRLPRVWLITDRRQMKSDLVEVVRATLASVAPGQAGIILREKDLDGGPLLALARRLREACPTAPLVINGRLDVALACGADGVHAGGDTPPPSEIRKHAPHLLLGASLHREEPPPSEADYALLSPIFETVSKPGAAPLGLAGLEARAIAVSTPLYALGGIDAGNAAACLRAGAAGIAVRGNVLLASDPPAALLNLLRAIESV